MGKRKRYKGILAKPIEKGEDQCAAINVRLEALCKDLKVDMSIEGWEKSALIKLAQVHVPGFQKSKSREKGGRSKLGGPDYFIRVAIDDLVAQHKIGKLSITRACEKLSKSKGCIFEGMSARTLKNRYEKASKKHREKLKSIEENKNERTKTIDAIEFFLVQMEEEDTRKFVYDWEKFKKEFSE